MTSTFQNSTDQPLITGEINEISTEISYFEQGLELLNGKYHEQELSNIYDGTSIDYIDTTDLYTYFKKEYDTINGGIAGKTNDVALTDASFGVYKTNLGDYKNKQADMKDLLSKYNSTVSALNSGITERNYVFFLIWTIIGVVVLFTVTMNVASDGGMNLFSMFLLIVFLLYAIYHIIKHFYLRYQGYN